MNVQLTDLLLVIDRCLMLVRHQLEIAGIELQLQLADDLPTIPCDPAQIEQVLLALIMNAIDRHAPRRQLWLTSRHHPAEQEIELQVRDDGPGIAPDILPQIFEPFVTTKENGRGVGLGLAISRGIIERHNGRIEVQSELGQGTIFTFDSARAAHRHFSGRLCRRTICHECEGMNVTTQGKLLIVDDELRVRDSLGKWFREEGYEVATTENASDALTRLAEQRWDLALRRHQNARH